MASKEHLVKEENLVYKDLKDLVVNEDRVDLQEHKVLVDHVVNQDYLGHKDNEVNKDLEENLDHKDRQVKYYKKKISFWFSKHI